MTEKKPADATHSNQEENVHAQNGYEAGKAEANEHGMQLWTGDTLVDKASSAAQDYRWSRAEKTDAPLSDQDWYAYRDGFVRGYQQTLAELNQHQQT